MPVKKTISFSDIDGNPVTEDWYFVLDEADASEMDLAHRDDVQGYLNKILKDRDSKKLLKVWRELLFASVGKREGKLLVKDEATVREFRYGGAYKQFFSEIIESDDAGAGFFMSIMPASVQQKVAAEQSKTYTTDEMMAMSDEDFDKAFGTDDAAWERDVLLVAMRRRNSAVKAA